MFKELINHSSGRGRPQLDGAYIGRFMGVSQRQRATFETRNDPEPVMEEVFVFEFELSDPDLDEPVRVSKWVRKPARLTHPGKSGKVTNLYRVLAALYGVSLMTDEQLERAEEFVQSVIGREYQLTLETKPSGWVEIVHIAPVRARRKEKQIDEVPF
jgi:hypothetical protein